MMTIIKIEISGGLINDKILEAARLAWSLDVSYIEFRDNDKTIMCSRNATIEGFNAEIIRVNKFIASGAYDELKPIVYIVDK
jgi:Zn-dependent peptidase ImmA (M78 family)